MPEVECWTCGICVRRLPHDGTVVPEHVGMTLVMNCVYDLHFVVSY